ncbi:hypothetical protein FRC10_007607, partial [Ceratobasidium sp. 414]
MSGFTFRVLRQFHLLATEAKLSAQRFYNVLVYTTSSLFPGSVPDRYREFMRATREWQFLQVLKRAGSQETLFDKERAGDLALRCPACPIPGLNCQRADIRPDNWHLFTQHVSFDGSFQLCRKNKVYDAWDTCLSNGRMYFVESSGYEKFLGRVKALGQKLSTR